MERRGRNAQRQPQRLATRRARQAEHPRRSPIRPRRDGLGLWLIGLGALTCFLLALAVPLFARAETPPPGLAAKLEEMVRVDGAPGVTLMVFRDGRLLYQLQAGETPDAPAPVASASKWVAAAVIMSLVDEGLLSLDQPVGEKLPAFHGAAGEITLRQLLSFTAGQGGLPDAVDIRQSPAIPLAASAAEVAARPLQDAPGAVFRYGGPSLQVAGALAEQVTGQTWAELFRDRLAEPLGMTHSHWTHPFARGMAPESVRNPNLQGGLVTTAEDYARFLSMLAAGGVFEGRRVLSTKAVEEMSTPQTRHASMAYVPPGVTGALSYNLGNWCEAAPAGAGCQVMSSPGALGTYPWIDRETGVYGLFFTRIRLPRIAPRIQDARRIIRDHLAPASGSAATLTPASGLGAADIAELG